MILLSMSMEENTWMIFLGGRERKRREKSTCSSLESKGRVKVTVSNPPPLAWNGDRYRNENEILHPCTYTVTISQK